MIGPGVVGSPTDVATLFVVVVTLLYEVRPTQDTLAAAVVALARRQPGVDDEGLQDDLDVDERSVDAVEQEIVACGGVDQ